MYNFVTKSSFSLLVFSGDIWDLENPSFIELPRLNPEKLLPVRDVALVKKKIWVTTGSFVTFLDEDTLISQVWEPIFGNQCVGTMCVWEPV